MSFSPDMVITLLGYVRTTLKFIETIKSQPDEIAEIGSRVRFLSVYLSTLNQTLLKRREQLDHFTPEQHAALADILDGLQANVQQVNTLLGDYRGNKGPWGLEWRFDVVSKIWHELGPRKEELEGLGEKIDRGRRDLSDTLGVMGFDGIHEVLNAVKKNQNVAMPTSTPPPAYSPKPPPAQHFKEYKIIFVDPYNEGRGVVAEAMILMFKHWTERSGAKFPVSKVHSAGFHVSSRSDAEMSARQSLVIPKGAKSLPWRRGDDPINPLAYKAMFHPKLCRPHIREAVEPTFAHRRSRGIRKDMFRDYDYIVVFHSREFSNLLSLKAALLHGMSGHEKEKMERARVVHLGPRMVSGKRRNVLDVDRGDGQDEGRVVGRRWMEKVTEIRGLTQEFLRERCGWAPPDEAAQ